MMAPDYMIQLADKNQDDKRKSLLEVVKDTVLSHLTKKCPPHESRQELLRRVAAGGGAFESKDGNKLHLPGGNLNDIANQAGDLLETMETRPVVPDRILLARLVSRNMMGGGILDERNDRGFSTLPESEVLLLCPSHHVYELGALSLKQVQMILAMEKILQPRRKKAEGIKWKGKYDQLKHFLFNKKFLLNQRQAFISVLLGLLGSIQGRKPLPVRPGMFVETVTKVMGSIYSGNASGITAQHLEWVHQKTVQVFEEIAY
ncbi:hypothetical protein IGI04_024630 [Brassica rapa subsp. trilocularis]|uniref:Uncharacterized protein n=1 Tax=Brassica rapa subsp. trilocularis TaxID=1813537 RepID=A0ABQ7M786_BRACM|nr:hypothetical protein IGI04_024630 [Brassica rapa subsp. trilocularis]